RVDTLVSELRAGMGMTGGFPCVRPNESVKDAADGPTETSQTDFPIVDDVGRLVELLNRDGIMKALAEKGAETRVAEAMRRDIPSVSEGQRLDDGLDLLQGGVPAIAVTGANDRLAGYITAENLLAKLMIER